VYDQSDGRVLGVHIVGDDACEMIHYGMELVRGKRTIAEVRDDFEMSFLLLGLV